MDRLFGKRKTPEELLRQNQRALNKVSRRQLVTLVGSSTQLWSTTRQKRESREVRGSLGNGTGAVNISLYQVMVASVAR